MPTHDPRFSHVIGFDDFPFTHGKRGNVPIVGVVYAGECLEGILRGSVRQDGANSTRSIIQLVRNSKFATRIQIILLQGVALGGFNVVDAERLHRELGVPVLIVARRAPNFDRIRDALLNRVSGGARKWRLIEKLGPMEPCAGVHVQRVGLTLAEAEQVITRYALHGTIPEPLRVAHLIAGGMATGQSRGRT